MQDVLRAWMFWKREDDSLHRIEFDSSPGPLKLSMSYDDDREKFGIQSQGSSMISHDSSRPEVGKKRSSNSSNSWFPRMSRSKPKPVISSPIVREDSIPPFAVAL